MIDYNSFIYFSGVVLTYVLIMISVSKKRKEINNNVDAVEAVIIVIMISLFSWVGLIFVLTLAYLLKVKK